MFKLIISLVVIGAYLRNLILILTSDLTVQFSDLSALALARVVGACVPWFGVIMGFY